MQFKSKARCSDKTCLAMFQCLLGVHKQGVLFKYVCLVKLRMVQNSSIDMTLEHQFHLFNSPFKNKTLLFDLNIKY